MSWRVVARREVLDVRLSRALWSMTGLFAVFGVGAVLLPAAAVGETLSPDRALTFLVGPLKLVVGLTALLAGYGAVAGPRTAGQLNLTLGLPIARSDLVVGAFLGRTAVVLAATLVGLVAAAGALLWMYGTVPAGSMVAFGALLGLLAATMTGIAVGISAACPTRGRAAVAAVAAFVLFEFFWGAVPGATYYAVEGSLPGTVVPAWVVLLERLQPFAAFEVVADHLLPAAGMGVQLSAEGASAAEGAAPGLADRLAGPPPAYLDPWVNIVTLVAWALVPLAVGTIRFARLDL